MYSFTTWESKRKLIRCLRVIRLFNGLEQKKQLICSVCLPHKSVRSSITSHWHLAASKWEYWNVFYLELLNDTEYNHKGSPNCKHFTKTAQSIMLLFNKHWEIVKKKCWGFTAAQDTSVVLRFSDHCWHPQVFSYSDGGVPTNAHFEHKSSGYATHAFLLYLFKMMHDIIFMVKTWSCLYPQKSFNIAEKGSILQ